MSFPFFFQTKSGFSLQWWQKKKQKFEKDWKWWESMTDHLLFRGLSLMESFSLSKPSLFLLFPEKQLSNIATIFMFSCSFFFLVWMSFHLGKKKKKNSSLFLFSYLFSFCFFCCYLAFFLSLHPKKKKN